ncbi:Acyl-CoA synthetase (AMP-forming)/AMP-acid ligase II [Palleronia marisminoris]|uniref:Long-chain-fatty-acid--CoA ligase n=1 Tax=Palleronia marisminoris TaxID=315423 RepID=A0A1Y5RVJ3_9RHOB|nr:class I adenylate-forming enzyme family protein [Palleronia marisminoris]SFG47870.1 Acyl-CoA synthetase (AMP-forming)/AMP-acid ligase II [Palleronia marisminoris]SLN25438.1 Long-chain-fatty-acid--CoA ligase [Palleronia marisminoris]
MTLIHAHIDRHAAERPTAPALRDSQGIAFDWAGYKAASEAAATLLKDHGVQPGDRVMAVAENSAALAALVFGTSRIGARLVPVNARMTAPEIARIAGHCRPRLTVFATDASPEARAHAAGAQVMQTSYGEIALTTDPGARFEAPDDTAVILYTTGTTGDPKGVMLTHGNLNFAGRASATLRGMVPGERLYGALPLTHVFGLASMLTAGAVAGAEVQLEARFAPDKLLAALQGGATVLPAVPQMHAVLMAHTAAQGIERLRGAALRYVSSGAAPLDPAWKRKAEAFYGLPLQNGYGMTETTAGVCATRNAIGDPDTSVGPPLPGCEIRIAAPDRDGIGEIETRGPHVMKGYYRLPELTAEALDPEGWLKTGDLGRIDDAGRLHIVGRKKELIIRSGFNVHPPEVEAALNDHLDVVQCAVIGRARNGNEDVLAFVQPARGGVDPAALADFARERLSAYKRPSAIFVVDALPAASTGKILKHRLLTTFADRIAAHDAGE